MSATKSEGLTIEELCGLLDASPARVERAIATLLRRGLIEERIEGEAEENGDGA